ncbi:hypothetical protein AAH994_11310 [Weeksellaceae bacterium A-14]
MKNRHLFWQVLFLWRFQEFAVFLSMHLRLLFLLMLFSGVAAAQHVLPLDSVRIRDTEDFFADDYGSIYLYRKSDFSFTKYDSVGNQQGRVMMTLPFRVQGVQNPLSIFLFSQNAQEIRLLDQNLNEIQNIHLSRDFNFIQAAYAEDLQQVWLLDGVSGKLIQYNYRGRQTVASYQMNLDPLSVISMLVYQGKMYGLTDNSLVICNLKGQKIADIAVLSPMKLRRENDFIYVITRDSILKLNENNILETVFSAPEARIVDKNSSSFFEVKGNKFYLYSRKLSDRE